MRFINQYKCSVHHSLTGLYGFVLGIGIFSLCFIQSPPLKRISGTLTTRQVTKGVSVRLNSDFHYSMNGKMVTHFSEPVEMVVSTNKYGELAIYYPKDNTVSTQISEEYSTSYTYFNYFLSNQSYNMGLDKLGMILKETTEEDGYEVNTYIPSNPDRNPIKKVELVFKDNNPSYIGYINLEDRAVKKIYFQDYVKLDKIALPKKITEINYPIKGDSSISRTILGNFKINEEAPNKYYDFKIPTNAQKCE